MTYELILLGCSFWLIWKFIKIKDLKYLFVAILILSLLLKYWPLYLPGQFTLAMWSFTASVFLIYESFLQKTKKVKSSISSLCIILFVVFGLVFFSEAIFRI